MRHALITTLATLAVATTACSEAASEPTAVETEALLASATAWTPSDLTRDLPVDDATRQKLEAGVQSLHASLLEMHARHERAHALEGDARDAYLAEVKAEMQELHEQHRVLWDSLDPAVRETIASRMHERMAAHDRGALKSLHERMKRMHGGDHDAGH
jgi:hypothetical protein